jgi:hypothetical protein
MIITQVQTSDHLQHHTTDLSKSYDPNDDTQIAVVDEISYRYDAATLQIQRMMNAGPWVPVAESVTALEFKYFDKTGTEIVPTTDTMRRSIRTITMSLSARTAEVDRMSGKYKTYTVRTQVTPRNLPMLPEA